MIDARFPPQPQKLSVPLYPQQEARWSFSFFRKRTLLNEMRYKIQEMVFPENLLNRHFFFMNSARACLVSYLRFYAKNKREDLIVALPSFLCPHLVLALRQAQIRLVFLDLDENYMMARSSVDFAAQEGAGILLWPSFFGARERNEDLLFYAKERGLTVILDEAQSFPHANFSCDVPTLFSFGKSKAIQGAGGGGIFLPFEDGSFTCFIKKEKRKGLLSGHKISSHPMPLFQDLEALTQEIFRRNEPTACSDIKTVQIETFLKRLIDIKQYQDRMVSLFESLQNFLTKHLGKDSLHPIKTIKNIPSIFAIRVPQGQRYDFSSFLARLGIQSSWYYYPLNKLNIFSSFPAENMSMTNRIAEEILIMPFGVKLCEDWVYDCYMRILEKNS